MLKPSVMGATIKPGEGWYRHGARECSFVSGFTRNSGTMNAVSIIVFVGRRKSLVARLS